MPTKPKPVFDKPEIAIALYRDRRREWRWQARAANGNVLADSGEGYMRRVDALRGLEAFAEAVAAGRWYMDEKRSIRHPVK